MYLNPYAGLAAHQTAPMSLHLSADGMMSCSAASYFAELTRWRRLAPVTIRLVMQVLSALAFSLTSAQSGILAQTTAAQMPIGSVNRGVFANASQELSATDRELRRVQTESIGQSIAQPTQYRSRTTAVIGGAIAGAAVGAAVAARHVSRCDDCMFVGQAVVGATLLGAALGGLLAYSIHRLVSP